MKLEKDLNPDHKVLDYSRKRGPYRSFDTSVFLDSLTPIKIYEYIGRIYSEFHAHTYLQMCYVKRGRFIHHLEDYAGVVSEGEVITIPPNFCHKYEKINIHDEVELIQFEFMPSFINENFKDLESGSGLFDYTYIEPFLKCQNKIRPKLELSDITKNQVEILLSEMLCEYAEKKKGYKHILKANLLKILILIDREYAYSKSADSIEKSLIIKYKTAIIEALRYIDQYSATSMRLDDVCEYSMLSQTYFSRFIKYFTGKTFTEYLNDLRIKNTVKLLNETNKSITDICFEVGFNEVAHFNRVFKKICGTSPSEYRKTASQRIRGKCN